jgi:predicted RNase H-like nuclease (RuvC/YqgF family)
MKTTLKDFNSRIAYLQTSIRETEERIEELKYENESLDNGEYEEFGYDEDDDIDYIISENESRIEEFEDKLEEFEQLLVVESIAAISDSDQIKKFKEIADKEELSEITSSYKVAVNPIWVEGSIYGRYIKRYDDGTDDDETALWILVAYVANSVIEPENMTAQDIDALIANAEPIDYGFDTLDSDVAIGFAREFLKAIEK